MLRSRKSPSLTSRLNDSNRFDSPSYVLPIRRKEHLCQCYGAPPTPCKNQKTLYLHFLEILYNDSVPLDVFGMTERSGGPFRYQDETEQGRKGVCFFPILSKTFFPILGKGDPSGVHLCSTTCRGMTGSIFISNRN